MHAARPCFQRILKALVLVASLGWLAAPMRGRQPIRCRPGTTGRRRSRSSISSRASRPRRRRTSCRSPSASPPSTMTARCGPSSRSTSSSPSPSIGSRRWRRSTPSGRPSEPFKAVLEGDLKALAAHGREGPARDRGGHPRRHDDRGVRQDRRGLARDRARIRASTGPTPISSTSRCSSCWPTCAPTGSRPSSSRAAASSSCGRGPRRSTASRPSRWSAPRASTKFEMRRRTGRC